MQQGFQEELIHNTWNLNESLLVDLVLIQCIHTDEKYTQDLKEEGGRVGKHPIRKRHH